MTKFIIDGTKRPENRRRRRGASLLEGFMYLVLFGIVAAGSLYMYQSAETGRKTTAAAGELGTVAAAIRNVYAGSPSYTGLENAQIQGSLPARMRLGAGTIQSSFNGPITVAAVGNDAFSVTFAGLPTEACKSLASKDFGRAVRTMSIGATVYATGSATPAQTETSCTGNNNSIMWTLN